MKHTFGEQLRAARQEAGMTQEQLAKASRISWNYLNSFERGHVLNPTVDLLAQLQNVLPRFRVLVLEAEPPCPHCDGRGRVAS